MLKADFSNLVYDGCLEPKAVKKGTNTHLDLSRYDTKLNISLSLFYN